jgi:hypothetical protein
MSYPDFVSGDVLNASDMNAVGLWLVKSSTFTTAATCPMESVFSSNYRNYKIFVSLTGSAANNHNLIFYTGTNTEYTSLTIVRYGWYYSTGGVFTNFYGTGLNTVFVNNQSSTAANISTSELTVFSPNSSTVRTNVNVNSMDASSGLVIFNQNIVDATTAFTGFVIKPGSGTLTGNIQVYGMKN